MAVYPSNDQNPWGDALRNWLYTAHDVDGTLKPASISEAGGATSADLGTLATIESLDQVGTRVTALEDGSAGIQAPPFALNIIPMKQPPVDPTANNSTDYYHTIRVMNGTDQNVNGASFASGAYRVAFDVSSISKTSLAIGRLRPNSLTNATLKLRWYNETAGAAQDTGATMSLVAAGNTTPQLNYVALPEAAIAQGDVEFFLTTTSTDSTQNIEMTSVNVLFLP